MSISPGQFKSLPHDEATKDLVEPERKGVLKLNTLSRSLCSVTISLPVSVLGLTNNQVLQLCILEPDRVGRFYPVFNRNTRLTELLLPGLERHGLVVDGVQKKVMDDFLQ